MLTYRVTPAIELREPLPQSDAPALLALLTANRAQYQYYLPWVAKIQTVADEQRFLTFAQAQLQQAQALNLVIVVEQRVAGMVSCDHFDDNDHSANIGYWLDDHFRDAASCRQPSVAFVIWVLISIIGNVCGFVRRWTIRQAMRWRNGRALTF